MQKISSSFAPKFTLGAKELVSRENLLLLLWLLLVNYSLGYEYKLIYVFSALSGFILLKRASKIAYRCLVLLFMVVGTLYAPVGINYGFPDINVMGSLMYTNVNEASEFLDNIPVIAWLLSLLVAISGIAAIWSSFYSGKEESATRGVYLFLAVFFILSAFWSPFRQGRLLSGGLPEIRFVHDVVASYLAVSDSDQQFSRIIATGSSWTPESLPGQHKTYIMVVGESVRRDYVHAFGGQYPNTPWLDSAPATLFTNYLSAGPTTVLSLTNTLARREGKSVELNNNVISLASRAGFETWWLSNQGKKGHFDSPVALMGESADHSVFTKSANSDDRMYSPDDQLIPMLEEALKQGHGKKFIVLHLMGSHPQACVRTQNKYDIDVGAREISCYIKSIAMTDQLLKQVYDAAEREGGDWSMMYFSDHGLSYVNRNTSGAYLTHGDKSRENYEVPFFILDKNQPERATITTRRSALNFLQLFSQWLHVREPGIEETCNLLSAEDCTPSSQVLNTQGLLGDYAGLPSVK